MARAAVVPSAGARADGSRSRAGRRGPALAVAAAVFLGVALLIGLGVWQLQRMAWKTALLGRIAALQTAPAEPLTVVLNRLADGRHVDFARVVTACEGLNGPQAHLYGLRTDGPGWRAIAACRLPASPLAGPYGSILVDLGFSRQAGMQPPGPEPVTLAPDALVTGVLRAPDPRPWFAALVAPAPGRRGPEGGYFARDIPAMAAQLGAPRPAPVMLLLEKPAAGPQITPSPLPTGITNRHLEYAVTWFGLAAALAGVWLASLLAARRGR